VLRHVAGIDVLQWTNDQADVSVRGYNQAYSPRLLVLIDGRQVYADFYGFTPWSTLPVELSAIRQIEIVKGPNSALFGFNAAGGVINIVTYNPLYDDVNTASLTGGTQNFGQGSLVSTLKLGDQGAVRLMAGGRFNDDFSTPAGVPFLGVRRDDDRASVDVNGVFRLSDKTTLDLEASHVTAKQDEITGGSIASFTRYETNSVKAQLTSDTDTGLWQTTAYSNWIDTAYQFGTVAFVPAPDFHNNVTVLQLQDSVKVGTDHTLRGTVEYRHNTAGTTPFGGADVFYDVIAAGGMWQWQIAPSLALTNALRIDHLMLGRSGSAPLGYPFANANWDRNTTTESFNSGLVW
jgi:outer membrane receptor for ferrienterochelin and colicins